MILAEWRRIREMMLFVRQPLLLRIWVKVVANANQWLDKEDFNYEIRASLYGEIIDQADEYVKHVLQEVGGIYLNDSYQGG